MSPLLRTLLLIALVLLIPVLPFLAWGAQVELLVQHWQARPLSPEVTAALIIGVLATDVLLPVPSSVISTLGGVRLGWIAGTAASWLGMTVGAVVAFAIARRWGRPVVLWFASESDLGHLKTASDQWGMLILVAVRGVPVLAEASVLLMGIQRMRWRQFLPALACSNLGIALAYSAFGELASRHQWLPSAMAVSIALPLLLLTIMQRVLRRASDFPRTSPSAPSELQS